MLLSGLSAGLQTKGLPVPFPVRAYAWVAGQVPSWGHIMGNHTLMFLSLSFSFPSPLSKSFLKNWFSLLTLMGTGDVLQNPPKSSLPGQCTRVPVAAGSAGCSPWPPSLENRSCPEGSHEPGGHTSLIPGYLEANDH